MMGAILSLINLHLVKCKAIQMSEILNATTGTQEMGEKKHKHQGLTNDLLFKIQLYDIKLNPSQ
jgi:hypothetical protein